MSSVLYSHFFAYTQQCTFAVFTYLFDSLLIITLATFTRMIIHHSIGILQITFILISYKRIMIMMMIMIIIEMIIMIIIIVMIIMVMMIVIITVVL